MTDHPKAVSEAREALVAAINAARAAGYRVDGAQYVAEINASETAKVGASARPAPGDEYDAMTKASLVELAAARGIEVAGSHTKADIIAALKNPPAPAG